MGAQRVAKVVTRDTNGVTRQTRETDATNEEPEHKIRGSSAGAAALMYD